MTPTVVRKATFADGPAIVASLLRAFATDPLLTWMFPRDSRGEKGLRTFFEMSLDTFTMPHGEVYTTDAREGAALWAPPGTWSVDILGHLGLIPRFVSATGISRALTVFAGVQAIERHHPKRPHFYLQILGVDPDHQGRGIAKALLAPVLARCDAEGTLAYLETAREGNVKIYETMGFRVASELRVPFGGPLVWTMAREPRAGRGFG